MRSLKLVGIVGAAATAIGLPMAASMLAASPASASPITLEFTSVPAPAGDNGGVSYVTVISGTVASGADLAIGSLIVTGTASNDGTYAVTGGVGTGFGDLSFDTSTSFLKIVGGIGGLGIADGTTLLVGTGSFDNIVVTAPACVAIPSHLCPTVSFDAPDDFDASLLSALGIDANGFQSSFFVTAEGTGNGFPQNSADGLSTQGDSDGHSTDSVPEPASLALFGAGFAGLGLIRGRRQRA